MNLVVTLPSDIPEIHGPGAMFKDLYLRERENCSKAELEICREDWVVLSLAPHVAHDLCQPGAHLARRFGLPSLTHVSDES